MSTSPTLALLSFAVAAAASDPEAEPPLLPPLRPPSFDPDRFLARVREFQYIGTPTSLLVQLRTGGLEVSPPGALVGRDLERQLWDLLHALAELHVFVTHTDHLSDVELYEKLWAEVFNGEAVELPPESPEAEGAGAYYLFDMVGEGSDEDIELYLRYYADEETRACWAEDWPEMEMPARTAPPYDRDARLP